MMKETDDSHSVVVTDIQTPDIYPYAPFLGKESIIIYISSLFIVWSFSWFYVGETWDPLGHAHKTHHMVLNCDINPNTTLLNSSFAPYLSTLTPKPLGDLYLETTIYNDSSPLSSAYQWVPMECPQVSGSNPCGTTEEELVCLDWMNDRLKHEKAWSLLYIPSNFTTTALSWFPGSGSLPSTQKSQVQLRYATGRDYTGGAFILAGLRQDLLPQARVKFMEVMVSRANALYPVNPAYYATGASHLRYDVAPVTFFGQNFASYIFVMAIWLGSAFVAAISYQFKHPTEVAWLDPEVSVKPSKMELFKSVCYKAAAALVAMFVLSLLITCVIWGLGKGDSQWYNNGGYCIAFLWYLSWSNLAFNAILVHAMGLDRFGSVMILLMFFQFATSSGILNVGLSSRFYRIGRMFPFYYGVRGLRTIFFGVMGNKMWVNWLVFTGYNVFTGIPALFFITHRIMSHAAERKRRYDSLAAFNADRVGFGLGSKAQGEVQKGGEETTEGEGEKGGEAEKGLPVGEGQEGAKRENSNAISTCESSTLGPLFKTCKDTSQSPNSKMAALAAEGAKEEGGRGAEPRQGIEREWRYRGDPLLNKRGSERGEGNWEKGGGFQDEQSSMTQPNLPGIVA